MLSIWIALFTHSFGHAQTINCSFPGISFNSSALGLVQIPVVHGYPYPFSNYELSYMNDTFIVEKQVANGTPAYLGTATYNNTRSNNANFDCYQKFAWTNASFGSQCLAYSMISFGANAFAYVGCYDYTSSQCPIACTPQYVLADNHTFFGRFYLNALNNDKEVEIKHALMNHQKFRENTGVSCSVIKGYNVSTIVYDMAGIPVVGYSSLYSNGTYEVFQYNGSYYANGTYNISASATGSDVQCNMYILFQDGPKAGTVKCRSFTLSLNGSAHVACTSNSETCPASCDPQFVLKQGNVWATSFRLNAIE